MIGAALAALALLGGAAPGAWAETLTLKADYWCPYNCTPGEKPEGYMIDIARAVFEPAGYTVVYELMPYDDAVEAARQGTITAVVGAARSDAPDLLFSPGGEGMSTYALATPKGSGFSFTGVDSLKPLRLGAIEDYTYDPAIDDYIAAHKGTRAVTLISGDTATRDLVTLLAERKVDVVIEDDAVLEYTFTQMGVNTLFDLTVAKTGQPVFIAFSPRHPKAADLVALLDKGLAELRRSGRLAEILRVYGLRDWQQ